jgi:hypothetical protein
VQLTRVRPVCPQHFGLLGVSLTPLAAPVCCGPSSLTKEDEDHRPIDSGDFCRYIMN